MKDIFNRLSTVRETLEDQSPVADSKKVAIAILDDILNDLFNSSPSVKELLEVSENATQRN